MQHANPAPAPAPSLVQLWQTYLKINGRAPRTLYELGVAQVDHEHRIQPSDAVAGRCSMTTTTDLQAAVHKTLTSRAFERFIGLAVSNAMNAQDGSLLLAAPRLRHVTFSNSTAGMYGLQQPGGEMAVRMFLRRANEEGYCAPGWYGSEIRWDKYGREWERSFGPLVCNDFGELVEVAQ